MGVDVDVGSSKFLCHALSIRWSGAQAASGSEGTLLVKVWALNCGFPAMGIPVATTS